MISRSRIHHQDGHGCLRAATPTSSATFWLASKLHHGALLVAWKLHVQLLPSPLPPPSHRASPACQIQHHTACLTVGHATRRLSPSRPWQGARRITTWSFRLKACQPRRPGHLVRAPGSQPEARSENQIVVPETWMEDRVVALQLLG